MPQASASMVTTTLLFRCSFFSRYLAADGLPHTNQTGAPDRNNIGHQSNVPCPEGVGSTGDSPGASPPPGPGALEQELRSILVAFVTCEGTLFFVRECIVNYVVFSYARQSAPCYLDVRFCTVCYFGCPLRRATNMAFHPRLCRMP